jgi:hypothetical protein
VSLAADSMSEELASQLEHESDDDPESPAHALPKRDRPRIAERGPPTRQLRLQSKLRAQARDEKRRLQSQLLAQARDERRAALSGTC